MRSLRRSQTKRMLAGICGGIGEYFGIDPTVIRLIWAVFSIATVFPGIIAYAVAWIVIPPEF
ncbi:MAG: PspC domain-containing protein [Firmicutes bacterium]|nr:PspC domain-containing protein [Bacillota bacterium]